MSTQDILNLVLILSLLVVTSCIVFITVFFIQALKSITTLAENLEETTQSLKEKLQMKALAALPALILGIASKIIKIKRG